MKVVFVVGPTAAGKSDLAIELCHLKQGVIINSDSHQFYQGLEIGSASPLERDKQRVPHYLFQILPPPQKATAGWFYRQVMPLLADFESQKKTHVFIVGGTGFYLQALEDGLLPVGPGDAELRSQLEKSAAEGKLPQMYQELMHLDPSLGQRIKAPDAYRIVRALEIIKSNGQPLSQIESEWAQTKPPFPYPIVKIGVTDNKERLLNRVMQRTQNMLEQGLIQEVQLIKEKGFWDWEALNSVGYLETKQFLSGVIATESDLAEAITKSTMRLIKKQKTWFKRDHQIQWVTSSKNQAEFDKNINYLQKLI